MSQSFFLSGSATDPAYLVARDSPNAAPLREEAECLWKDYRSYADTSFRADAMHQFLQRYWEMYVAVALLGAGLELTKHGDVGPEFSFDLKGRRVWLEAVAPTAGSGRDAVPPILPGQYFTVPTERIALRFTNAFGEKRSRHNDAVAKGIVVPDDAYILAMNSRAIPHGPHSGTIPFYVQALLPIGQLTLSIDKRTKREVDRFHAYRPFVEKVSGASVSTSVFLEPASSFCSAVLHSAVDFWNHPACIGSDFSVLHNPSAAHPIGHEVFSWCEQFRFADDALHREEPLKSLPPSS